MIHIKETEIIPLLKEAQTEYSQKITEGDPKDVEMAERIEEALTQAMDIVYDYQSMADEHKRMVEKYEVWTFTAALPAEREPPEIIRTATGAERNWGGKDDRSRKERINRSRGNDTAIVLRCV
mgnify:CR=1 FL=1